MKTPLLRDYNAEIELNNNQKEDERSQRQLKMLKKETSTNNSNTFYLQSDLTNTSVSPKIINNSSNNNNNNNKMQTPVLLTNNSNQNSDSCCGNNNSRCNSNLLLNNLVSSPTSIRSNNTILNGTNSSILCRICYGSDGKEHLLQPCNCSGTMGLMHRTCLERWLSQSNSTRCEICQFDFSSSIEKVPKSFSQWLFRPLSTKDNKNLFNDFVCFLILTPLACISTWYCILFALKFHESENRWEAAGLVVLTTFLLFIYILWFIVFKDWQKKNQIVTLRLSEDGKIMSKSIVRLKSINQIQYTSSSNETLIQLENEIIENNQNQTQTEENQQDSTSVIGFNPKKCVDLDLNDIEIRMQNNNNNTINNNNNVNNCQTNTETCVV